MNLRKQIAFGSLHWPKPEQLAAFLEGIMESNVPFVRNLLSSVVCVT